SRNGVQGSGHRGEYAEPAGQETAHQIWPGQAPRYQAGDRHHRAGRAHRHLLRARQLIREHKEDHMAIRKYKPTTPGRRGSSVADFVELTRSTPEKSLVTPNPKTGGRNNAGKITPRHIGGGHKQAYRLIDFKRYDKDGVPAKVAHIE